MEASESNSPAAEILTAYSSFHRNLSAGLGSGQAKGILMEQNGCTADEASGLLRQASQRSNVPVRDLAARIGGNQGGRPRGAAGGSPGR